MVRVAVLILIFLLDISAYAADVCIVNSYPIPPAKKLEEMVRKLLLEHNHRIVKNGCDVKILIGTPAVVKEMEREGHYKVIYTFVLFPEKFGLEKRKNFYGVRIFPLPVKTYKRFLRKYALKEEKVAVPISRDMVPIARMYLPRKYFVILPFKNSPVETFRDLLKYKYVYIFPDPKLLKLINLVTLVNFCKDNGLLVFSGLSDLSKFNLNYVDEIDYEKLAKLLVFLVNHTPKEKIISCPCRKL